MKISMLALAFALIIPASARAYSPPPTPGNPCNSRSGGVFPDLAFYGGRLWCAVEAGGSLQVVQLSDDLNVMSQSQRKLPGGLAFPRLGVFNGALWVAYRDGSTGMLWNVTGGGEPESLGAVGGNDPVAIGGQYVFYQGGPAFGIFRRPLGGGAPVALGPGRPTGLSRGFPDGHVTLIDDDRMAVPFGTRPCWAGDMVVVEGPDGGSIIEQAGSRGILWPGATAFTPKCAASGDGGYAVTNWGDKEVRTFLWRTRLPGDAKIEEPSITWLHPSRNGTSISGVVMLSGSVRDPENTSRVDIMTDCETVCKTLGAATLSGKIWTFSFDAAAYSGHVNLSALWRPKSGETARNSIGVEVGEAGRAAPAHADPPVQSAVPGLAAIPGSSLGLNQGSGGISVSPRPAAGQTLGGAGSAPPVLGLPNGAETPDGDQNTGNDEREGAGE